MEKSIKRFFYSRHIALLLFLSVSACPPYNGQAPNPDTSIPAVICDYDGAVDVDQGEECDDGNFVSTDDCIDCVNTQCGDGYLNEISEQCDDGNTTSGDGCGSDCALEGSARCGNDSWEFGEDCDDGNTESGDFCSPFCELEVSSYSTVATISDDSPFVGKTLEYSVYPENDYSYWDSSVGIGAIVYGVRELGLQVVGVEGMEFGGYVEIYEATYDYAFETWEYSYVTAGSFNGDEFFSSYDGPWFTVYLDKTLCQFPTWRYYYAVVYPATDWGYDWSNYSVSGYVFISVAHDNTTAIYEKTGAHVSDILYRDGSILNIDFVNVGHAAIYYGKDVENNDLVIESNTITDACGESGEGVRITFARNSLDNHKWYGAFYSPWIDNDPDAAAEIIADAECQLGAGYSWNQWYSYVPITSCGSRSGYFFRCDMFTQYLYGNQGVDISVYLFTSPWLQMADDDLVRRSEFGSLSSSLGETDEPGIGVSQPVLPQSIPEPTTEPEFQDTDGDGVYDYEDNCDSTPNADQANNDSDEFGDVCDDDDDNDGMPDTWEDSYGLNPFDSNDVGQDADGDRFTNLSEYQNSTDPNDTCSPTGVEFCFYYAHDSYTYAANNDDDILDPTGQCGSAADGPLGVYCVPVDEWTPAMIIDADSRAGGCQQRFSIRSQCAVDLTLCVDYHSFASWLGEDGGQCWNQGTHCAAVNTWTDAFTIDTDGRNGGCKEQFSITGDDGYTLNLDFQVGSGSDSGQCSGTGTSSANSTTDSLTDWIYIDTDDRAGGCNQALKLESDAYDVLVAGPTIGDDQAFCGESTYSSCSGDSDCTNGCGGTSACMSVDEMPTIRCDYVDPEGCYDFDRFGVSCGCVNNQCAWEMP